MEKTKDQISWVMPPPLPRSPFVKTESSSCSNKHHKYRRRIITF